jgi:Ca2+-transporting ATPase
MPGVLCRREVIAPNTHRGSSAVHICHQSVVVYGRARGLVVETGPRTVLGTIAGDVKEVVAEQTPLLQRLDRFAKIVGVVVLGFSAAVFVAGALRGESLAEIFMVAVATAVSAIPEGLPVAVTITMAVGVARMARRHAIIRKLPAVETLGSTTVIGSDKTGTLTKNEMTVRLVHDGSRTFEVTGSGYEPEGAILRNKMTPSPEELPSLRAVLRIGLLCNESQLFRENDIWRVDGDPTEGALIVAASKSGLEPQRERRAYPRKALLPFESERGYMASLHEWEGGDRILIKGSPEKILEMCSEGPGAEGLDREAIMAVAHDFASEGLRVLALGFKPAPAGLRELKRQQAPFNAM